MHFTRHEEEQFVLHDWTTEGCTPSSGLVFVARAWNLHTVNSIATHVFVAVIHVNTTLHSVGTTLGNGVHTTTDEVRLTNVEWRNHNLHFFDSFERDRVATTRKLVSQTEVVVKVRTVNSEVCHTAVATSDAHTIASVR